MAEFVLSSRQAATRRQRRLVTVSIVAALLMAILAVFAWRQRGAARRNEALAMKNEQQALSNEKLAQEQRDLAQKNERLAKQSAEVARRQTEIAEERRSEAERQARIALGRQVAAQALTMADTEDADLGLLLAVQASLISDTVESKSSLLSGLVENQFLKRYLHAHEAETVQVAFSHRGELLATVGCVLPGLALCETYGIRLWDTESLQPVGDLPLPRVSGQRGSHSAVMTNFWR